METNSILDNVESVNDSHIELRPETVNYIAVISKSAKIAAVVGFVVLGLLLINGILNYIVLSRLYDYLPSNDRYILTYIPIISGITSVILHFFPLKYLFDSSKKMNTAVVNRDSNELTEGLRSLKSHFKFIGILTIVMLSLMILFFLLALIGIMAN